MASKGYLLLEITPQNISVTSYCMYGTCSIFGIIGNSILIYAVGHCLGFFGERKTFTFLMMSLSLLDFSLSFFILLELLFVHIITKLYIYDYFMHPRNCILILESLVLFFIALDRFLAIYKPFSKWWKLSCLIPILSTLALVMLGGEATIFGIKHWSPRSSSVRKAIKAYKYLLTTEFCLLMFLTFSTYIVLFIVFYRHTQAIEANLHKVSHYKEMKQTRRLQDSSTGPAVSPATETVNEVEAASHHAATSSTSATANSKLQRDPSHQVKNPRSRRRQQYIHLVRVLLCVTSVYAFSMVPHFLGAWEIIPEIDFLFYYVFYINCAANPLITLATDQRLRTDLMKKWFDRGPIRH